MYGPVKLTPCHNSGGNQHFTVGEDNTIVNSLQCVEAPDEYGNPIVTAPCTREKPSQQFIYSKQVRKFYNTF